MRICVYGAASNTIDEFYIKEGEKLGRLLALRGHGLVYGAGATGLMGAVSRGVEGENGDVIGVVPEFFTNEEVLNLNCTTLVRTKTMRERKQIMEDYADAFIITPGGIGTFEEFFEILTLKQLNRHDKPIVILNTRGYYDPMIKMLEHSISEGFLKAQCRVMYPAFDTPEQVLEYVENYKSTELKGMK